MKARGRVEVFAICLTVPKYQGQVVREVGTKSTLVLLAGRDEFPRLPEHPFLPVTE
jgi:hypothetical protein